MSFIPSDWLVAKTVLSAASTTPLSRAEKISEPGRDTGALPANTYKGIVNNRKAMPLPSFGLTQIAGAHVSDDVIYKITKGFFENIKEIHQANPWLRNMSKKDPFWVLNVPLHPGAYKYYKEAGITVPKN